MGRGVHSFVLQGGKVLIIPSNLDENGIKPLLELSSENMIVKDFEEGLLGLVFHPKYKSNGLFLLISYSTISQAFRFG